MVMASRSKRKRKELNLQEKVEVIEFKKRIHKLEYVHWIADHFKSGSKEMQF